MHDRHALPGTDVVIDGVRLHVVEHGPAAAPVLVLVHGLPTSGTLWSDVARDLEHSHRCLLPDLVGLGESESPAVPGAFRPVEQARRLLGLLDTLQVDRFAIGGHDIGGAIAVHVAALAPERITGLALLTATVHEEMWPVPQALPYLIPGLGRVIVTALRRAPARALGALRAAFGTDLPDSALRPWVTALCAPDGGRGALAVFRAMDLAATEAALPLLAGIPALVLWGEQDTVHDVAYGRRVAAALPGAAWVPVQGGHLLPAERPERVAEELHAFLAEVGAAG
ncbi:MAG TPA: alpha/beta hydrolase [Mycobacteriales bacterium]|jgi:pimeloyl-ACP methyl ester carboxylesterase|nr:alpha/beta hydrolase [Mycobacteriales bacterium]